MNASTERIQTERHDWPTFTLTGLQRQSYGCILQDRPPSVRRPAGQPAAVSPDAVYIGLHARLSVSPRHSARDGTIWFLTAFADTISLWSVSKLIIKRNCWQAILPAMLPFHGVSKSVCLSPSCTVLKRQNISTIFAYDSPMCLPDRVKIWLTSANFFLTKFCPKVTHPCWFERWRHSMANCSWMVRGNAMITMESL